MKSISELERIINTSIKDKGFKKTTERSLYAYFFKTFFCDVAYKYMRRRKIYDGYTSQMFHTDYYKADAKLATDEQFALACKEINTRIEHSGKEMSVQDLVTKIVQFRSSFKLPMRNTPSVLTKRDYDLHYKLGKEELDEYLEACEEGNKVEILDALIDRLYILIGTFVHHGMSDCIEEAFNEVHSSNMSKLDKNGNPIYREDGKVLKSNNFFKPNLRRFL